MPSLSFTRPVAFQALLWGILVLTGCSSLPPEDASAPTSASVSEVAEAGKKVFLRECARCHGPEGQGQTGPALWGPKAYLVQYRRADTLMSFIRTGMPIDRPGSLTEQEYQQVLVFLLVQNKLLQPDIPFQWEKVYGLSFNR